MLNVFTQKKTKKKTKHQKVVHETYINVRDIIIRDTFEFVKFTYT